MQSLKRFLAKLLAVVGIIIVTIVAVRIVLHWASTQSLEGWNDVWKLPQWTSRFVGVQSITPMQLTCLAIIAIAFGYFVDADAASAVVRRATEGVARLLGDVAEGAGDVITQVTTGLVSGLGPLLPWIVGGVGVWLILRNKNGNSQGAIAPQPLIIQSGVA
jgi:small-conductance mechanosensitive channel